MYPFVTLSSTLVPEREKLSMPGGGRVAGPPNQRTFFAVAGNPLNTVVALPPPSGIRQSVLAPASDK